MNPIIIVGTGLAGYTLAREFRKLNKTAPLLLVTADDGGFYSKPMLSNAFAQRKQPAELLTQTAAQMAEQLGATILTGARVESIDTDTMTVTTSAGTFAYDKLVLAVGAQPIRLAIDGNAADQIMSVNHINDYQHFRQRISASGGASRVMILGAGLIGCEFADDLAGAGHQVTLVDPSKAPLAALAPPALSQGLRVALEARGIGLRLGTTAARIDRVDGGLTVSLADGSVVETDIVLSAVGLRPDLRLAQAANVVTGRGIVVDAFGKTSAAHMYALGDCAEYTVDGNRNIVLPYIAPLMAAARAFARTLDGQPTAIDLRPTPVMVKTPSLPLALVPPPSHAAAGGNWHETSIGEQVICRFYDENGCMRGFGVAPHEAKIRQSLLAELGSPIASAA
ncbi:MAG TPA: FAD-dependent oxidoreductase [Noviherbaspirillum sp.]|uniref:FAD-dependent oxidoreductase n=1 Tax=Noviherbaspirillum sp. TaxID=1926288 RepID=UPI002B4A551D|nr:FAD-dependent oxidoreductase [Noviherbaspirillum sp.]HJV86573.1 FAD-dependent oxidoreductase [Noviherbaspirillum sp.]